MTVGSNEDGELADSQNICACTCTSVGVEIGSCITSRRACSSVLGVLRSRCTARRNPGTVNRPTTTIAVRITIVVRSPFDKALPASRFIDRSKRGNGACHSIGQAGSHLIKRGAVRHADAGYLDGYGRRAHRTQLPHRSFERSFGRTTKTLRHLDLDEFGESPALLDKI